MIKFFIYIVIDIVLINIYISFNENFPSYFSLNSYKAIDKILSYEKISKSLRSKR